MKKFTTFLMSLVVVMITMIANAAEYSVYFDNSTAKWSKVNVYGWNGVDFGTWPGSAVTETTEEGYYKVTVTADADPATLGAKIIFNNGSAQTADLAWVTDGIYNQTGNTGNLYGGGSVEMFEFSIYFDNSTANWSTVNVYGWNGVNFGAWPGSAITEKTAEGYYKVTVKETVSPAGASVIFNDGTSQTDDLIWVDNAIYNQNGNTGKLYDGTVIPNPDPDPETGVTYNVTVPVGTPACYIAGEMNSWTQQEMNKVDDTHYTLTIENATKAMKYKYSASASWDNVEMQADGVSDVQDRTWSENDVVAAWKGLTTTDPSDPETLTYSVTVPAGTPACYIAGAMNDWSFTEMTKVDDTHYEITFENVTKATQYKYACGDSWDYEEVTAEGGMVQNRTWSANDVVAAWKATPSTEPEIPETLTYNVTVPAGTLYCFIAGEMNDWSFTEMTKVDDTHYTITFDDVTKSTKYKYSSGDSWEYVETWADGNDVLDRKWSESDIVEAWKSVWTSVSSVEVADVKVYGANGVLCVRAAEEVALNVYNAQGMLVKALVVEGAADINLAAGLYIVNGTKVLVY